MDISTTGVITWTPLPSQTCANDVLIAVSDSYGATAEQYFTIYVNEIATLRGGLRFISTPLQSVRAGALYQYQPVVVSEDHETTITFSLLTAPDGMTIDAKTGLVTWQTDAPDALGTSEDYGEHWVILQARQVCEDCEGKTYSATQDYKIKVEYYSIVGDINRDGSITDTDIGLLADILLGRRQVNKNIRRLCDMNFDGIIDVADIVTLMAIK